MVDSIFFQKYSFLSEIIDYRLLPWSYHIEILMRYYHQIRDILSMYFHVLFLPCNDSIFLNRIYMTYLPIHCKKKIIVRTRMAKIFLTSFQNKRDKKKSRKEYTKR